MSMVSPSSDQQLDRAALAALYEETFKNLEEGTITEGRVVAVTKDKVVVDIGYKSEGMIPNDQFSTEELQNIKVGDRLQVYIEECEDADGNLVLSKEKADKMKIWEELEKLFNDGKEHRRQDRGADQRRHDGGYRCQGVSAGLADRPSSGAGS